MVLKDKCFPILFLYILESTLCSFENFIIYVLYIFFLCLILAYIHIQHVYHGSSCFPIKNCAYGYRKYAGKCHVFHDFYGIDSSAVLCLQDDLWMVFLKCTPGI